MCGRTAVSLAPDDIVNATGLRNRAGRRIRPRWRGGGGGGSCARGGTGATARQAKDGIPTDDVTVTDDSVKDVGYRRGYNIPPGSKTPVLVAADHFPDEEGETKEGELDVVIEPMRWGLVPSWHKGDSKEFTFKTSNCRSESMLEKNLYKRPLEKGRRCVVVADGFYEWKTDKKTKSKQPYFFRFPQKTMSTETAETGVTEDAWTGPRLLTMAGIFDRSHPNGSEEPLYSFTVITTQASSDVSSIHHRMPAVLNGDEEVISWLNHGEIPLKSAVNIIKPKACLDFYPVSTFVNKVGNDSPECMKEIEISKPTASGSLMSSWLKKKNDDKTTAAEPQSKVKKTE